MKIIDDEDQMKSNLEVIRKHFSKKHIVISKKEMNMFPQLKEYIDQRVQAEVSIAMNEFKKESK